MTAPSLARVADTPAELVRSAVSGDEAAFARIVHLHHADMTRVAFVVSGDATVADDAVQAAWSVAWRKLGTVRDADRLRPWLVSVAANEARQLIRHQRRRAVVEIDPMARASEGGLDPAQRVRDLDLTNALATLSVEDRTLVALRYVAGLNATELGRALGMTPSGTRSRLARALERLRAELGDD